MQNRVLLFLTICFVTPSPDMEKSADTRTLSAEILENCGNFLIVDDFVPLFSESIVLFLEIFDETFNIWHI